MIIIRQFATLHPRRLEWNWPISCLNEGACYVPSTHFPPRSVRLRRSFRKSVSIYSTSALRHLNQGPWVGPTDMVQCQENLWISIFSCLSHQIAAPLHWKSHFTTYNILNVRKTLSFSLVKLKKKQIAKKRCIYSKMFFFFLKPASNIVRTITAVFHARLIVCRILVLTFT